MEESIIKYLMLCTSHKHSYLEAVCQLFEEKLFSENRLGLKIINLTCYKLTHPQIYPSNVVNVESRSNIEQWAALIDKIYVTIYYSKISPHHKICIYARNEVIQ